MRTRGIHCVEPRFQRSMLMADVFLGRCPRLPMMPRPCSFVFSEAPLSTSTLVTRRSPPPRAQTLFGNALVRETLFRSGRGGGTGRRVETECFVRHVQG